LDGKIDVAVGWVKDRQKALEKQLEAMKGTIIGRGWWSYLTPYPVIDFSTIMEVTAGWEIGPSLTIAILPAKFPRSEPDMREVIIASVGEDDDQVHVRFPLPPGRVDPEIPDILEGYRNGA